MDFENSIAEAPKDGTLIYALVRVGEDSSEPRYYRHFGKAEDVWEIMTGNETSDVANPQPTHWIQSISEFPVVGAAPKKAVATVATAADTAKYQKGLAAQHG